MKDRRFKKLLGDLKETRVGRDLKEKARCAVGGELAVEAVWTCWKTLRIQEYLILPGFFVICKHRREFYFALRLNVEKKQATLLVRLI
jgi:hypothetical protein